MIKYTILILTVFFWSCNAQTTGSFETNIQVNATIHTLAYYVPVSYDSTKSYPLIVALHGCNGSATAYRTSFISWANAHNAILVSPDYFGNQMSGSGGSELITATINHALGGYNIDSAAVYLTGFSCNGQETMKQGFNSVFPFRGLIPLNPWIPNTTGYNYAGATMPTCICSGTSDPSHTNSQVIYNNIVSNGKDAYFNSMPGIGHVSSFGTRNAEMDECKTWIDSVYNYKIASAAIRDYPEGKQSLLAYPNPTGGDISIDLRGYYKLVTVKVYNTSGQLMETIDKLEGELIHVQLSLPPGIYTLGIMSEDLKLVTTRLIIN